MAFPDSLRLIKYPAVMLSLKLVAQNVTILVTSRTTTDSKISQLENGNTILISHTGSDYGSTSGVRVE
uniref:Uncharacterized protein n=1 Tax=Solanum tuberosum TaxID=4113 RepID=Q0KIJ2_SOLTU|nr:hypothetical protein STB1_57t00005 [Solanum tuberosum]